MGISQDRVLQRVVVLTLVLVPLLLIRLQTTGTTTVSTAATTCGMTATAGTTAPQGLVAGHCSTALRGGSGRRKAGFSGDVSHHGVYGSADVAGSGMCTVGFVGDRPRHAAVRSGTSSSSRLPPWKGGMMPGSHWSTRLVCLPARSFAGCARVGGRTLMWRRRMKYGPHLHFEDFCKVLQWIHAHTSTYPGV